jgi:hypothetical protein
MLFRTRWHEPISRGAVTLTVRAWSRPQAKVGGSYNVGGSVIEVTALEEAPLGSLDEAHARAAGFATLDELKGDLERTARRRLAAGDVVWLVSFRTAGAAVPKPAAEVTAENVARALRRLAALDAAGERAWTARVLTLIGERPGTAARLLAAETGAERLDFKADVRKLKAAGLTSSLVVGYELTPLGRAVLATLRDNP